MKIQLKSEKTVFEIGDQKFETRFTDSTLQKFWEAGNKINQEDKEFSKNHPGLKDLDDPQKAKDIDATEQYDRFAGAVLDSLPKSRQEFTDFFDLVFGEGSGQKIYSLCGESTYNMERVFDSIWNAIIDHMYGRTAPRRERRQDRR
ncbi:MAG: hypothetical protein ACE3JK_14565 [Sporolactobacillus sp.]